MPVGARQSALCTIGVKRKKLIGRPSSLNTGRKYSVK
jgi:hypothetical protein